MTHSEFPLISSRTEGISLSVERVVLINLMHETAKLTCGSHLDTWGLSQLETDQVD